jgi:hypothetical protein
VALAILLLPSPAHAVAPLLAPNNLALGQLTGQSSTIYGDDSSIAVDGVDGGDWSDGTATLTGEDFHSWWEVDLGQSRHIGSIEVINRTDCCQQNIFPFMVIVADFPIIDTDMTDADGFTYPGITRIIVGNDVEAKYVIPVHRTGEYVRIALLQENTSLSMGEVKVFEEYNAALGRSTQESKAYPTGATQALGAVDSDVEGVLGVDQVAVAVSTSTTKAWWQVDLGAPQPIGTVDVWSTNTTCCSTVTPLPAFTLWASPNPFNQTDPSKSLPVGTLTVSGNVQGAPATVSLGGFTARYIEIQVATPDALSLAEVQVWPVARGSVGSYPTISSKAGTATDPFAAIDFNLNAAGNDVTQKDVHTAVQTDPYYELDLGGDRFLEGIKLWGQADLSSTSTYSVFTSEFTPFPPGATAVQLRTQAINTGFVEYKNVGTSQDSLTGLGLRARWVRVMVEGAKQQLGFREAEIFTTEGYMDNYGNGIGGPVQSGAGFHGYHSRPNEMVDVYAFKPNAGSGGGFYDNWVYLTSAQSSSVPKLVSGAVAPLYEWKTPIVGFPAGVWVKGGVLGLYAQADVNPGADPVATPLRGINNNPTGAQAEDVFWPDIYSAATDASPDTNATPPPYLARPMGTALNTSYYNLHASGSYVEIPSTLAKFNSQYLGSGAVSAKYFNKGDLGIGRAMTCARPVWTVNGSRVTGTACAVSNYAPASAAGSKAPVSFNDQSGSIALIQKNAPPFATVVMIKRDGSNTTMFGVYQPIAPATTDPSKTKLIQTPVALDSTAFNTSVPNNCMACHGGSFGSNALSLTGQTAFLPFDPNAMGSDDAPYDYSSQTEAFRKLNNIVALSKPTAAVTDFITGSYHGGVATANTKFDFNYVPAGWLNSTAQTNVYNKLIKPDCRGCHMSQVNGTNGGVDMLSASAMEGIRASVLADVCLTHLMPHSQLTTKNGWSSDARAYLLSYFGRGDLDQTTMTEEACKP